MYFDFYEDDKLVAQLETFVKTKLKRGFNGAIPQFLEAMQKSRDPIWKHHKPDPKVEFHDKTFNILLYTPRHLAHALTEIDYSNYERIHFTELLDQAWNKEKKRHRSPNLMRNINFFNTVSNWVAVQILEEKDIRQRRKVILFFLKTLAV